MASRVCVVPVVCLGRHRIQIGIGLLGRVVSQTHRHVGSCPLALNGAALLPAVSPRGALLLQVLCCHSKDLAENIVVRPQEQAFLLVVRLVFLCACAFLGVYRFRLPIDVI